jgi:rhodanese-related sulfurtransferase
VWLRRIALGALLSGALVLGSACTSGDDGSSATTTADRPPATLVDADAFERRIDEPDVVTINVHTPDEGSIAGTDLAIPFDQIESSDELPADRSTPLAVYCRSGNMSADAVDDLATMGYTDIVELEGGFDAWVASGRTLAAAADGG